MMEIISYRKVQTRSACEMGLRLQVVIGSEQ
jgi:hypothetical protein